MAEAAKLFREGRSANKTAVSAVEQGELYEQIDRLKMECIQTSFAFHPLGGRQVTARFDGGTITSDGGGLLLREVEPRARIIEQFAACFDDFRDPAKIEHTVLELLKQRIFGLALGYEDLNDHEQLRHDPLLAVLVEKRDPTGEERLARRSRGDCYGALQEDRRPPSPGRKVFRRFLRATAGVAAGRDRVGPGRHRRSAARPPTRPLLSWLLRRLLLAAAVHLLWGTPAVRQTAASRY